MQVKDIMTTNIIGIQPNTTLKDAALMMSSSNVGALPVVKNGNVIGIVTDRDIAIRGMALGLDPTKSSISNIMTSIIVACFEDQELSEAAKIMKENHIRRVLVFDRNKQTVGIVSITDIAFDKGDSNQVGKMYKQICRGNKQKSLPNAAKSFNSQWETEFHTQAVVA